VQPQLWLVGDGKAAGGQQRADLADGAGDGGAVDAEQHPEGLMGQLGAQTDQGRQHPVAEGQPVAWAGAGRPAPGMAPALVEGGLAVGGPGVGQLDDEVAEVLPGDAGEARMGQGRTGPCWRSHSGMIVRPCSCLHDRLNRTSTYRAPSRYRPAGCDTDVS
jgi:hypothetical protein